MRIWNPWRAANEARAFAEKLARDKAALQEALRDRAIDNDQLGRDISFLIIERDNAREELAALRARRSAAVSRGNRTRALRRRGALLPSSINDIGAGDSGFEGRNLTG